MTKIDVTAYEKTRSHCPQCEDMRKHFERWLSDDENIHHDITRVTLSAEDNRDLLIELGVMSAPVYVIERDGKTSVVSGNNPDILIDALNGVDGIWD
ncbi:thioredoxin [Corynebacterium phage Kimchi1738]|uniref:Thioredoxin n=1 Tax=Corynebacterium phage Kimchi1738 TaxID=2483719 RepID=A0A3G3LWI0_9CAUD|nr:thioredoxin [Corynebacterium phage Kimchi1738]AYQ98438.1 thioredoxin [Corynebacterium phage Kimchi1738]